MQSKRIIWLCVSGWIGGYMPLLWGGGVFSFSEIIPMVFSIGGIYLGYRITR